MKEKILIVEDEFIVANDLKMILVKSGYEVCGIAASVEEARILIETKKPNWVLLDIILKGNLTGIDLAWELEKMKIPFLYISANTNHSILNAVKETQPYGFLVKPFRERDLFVMLDIARYKYSVENGNKLANLASKGNKNLDIIGKNKKLVDLMQKIEIVAPTETSVMILGESGTGKEKIANLIHSLSAKKAKPLVVVNCAALPESLIESELFGHEKGAFTGADNVRIGKFEQANGGTIFLDEIGELPLDSQVKLLRVLQEKEIERLGSEKTIKLDVRIIAATNRCLPDEVAEGRFRLDLYYRLNVFPLELPALRDRKEDIEDLAHYFLQKYALKSKRNIKKISAKALQQLQDYDWPGNIRELEHLVERSVLMATENEIKTFDITRDFPAPKKENDSEILSLADMEKEHIMNVLKIADGKVFGPGGAAEILKISPSTLYSKMKKLNIKQGYF
ncbi:sigma-54-dependent Fis family transcriptional regulator [Flavobacterium sp. ANB]|uniref:sigma-54-dependent transcriptional regulator n=1 Tax=unclassified Flavobacterium TaxID=196869 RepID=UPI0012B6F1F6|nr:MULTISPECIES: sigma-54 dependent transcriptional regulator [unclassified Flavobacterium]MBF4515535.1 sigma-54-dependent Fis family transcriptional regulator [Flavobacterium sp. ANB]MTD68538.1 response regulator [Flavobacterium sp. LC2016-13]